MKNVTLYASNGRPAQVIQTTAATWGELQIVLREKDINFSGMKAMIGETRNSLESNQAMLPTGDMTLFLMPKKTKSGMPKTSQDVPYAELKKEIKQIIEDWGETGKTHFNKDKNYTQKKEDDLRKLYDSWHKKHDGKQPPAKESKATKKAAPKKATSKQKDDIAGFTKQGPVKKESALQKMAKETVKEVVEEMDDIQKINAAIELLHKIENPNCKTHLDVGLIHLDDAKYVIATGKPRIDNVRLNKLAEELKNDPNLGLRQY